MGFFRIHKLLKEMPNLLKIFFYFFRPGFGFSDLEDEFFIFKIHFRFREEFQVILQNFSSFYILVFFGKGSSPGGHTLTTGQEMPGRTVSAESGANDPADPYGVPNYVSENGN